MKVCAGAIFLSAYSSNALPHEPSASPAADWPALNRITVLSAAFTCQVCAQALPHTGLPARSWPAFAGVYCVIVIVYPSFSAYAIM